MKKICILVLALITLGTYGTTAQVVVQDSLTAQELANILVGNGVVILNPTMNAGCPGIAAGKFDASAVNIGIDSGIVLTSGRVETVGGQFGVNAPYTSFASTDFSGPGDPDLTAIIQQTSPLVSSNDACVLEFDFVPAGDSVSFEYVFASEEYNGPHGNFNCSINDVFAFFISGPGFTGPTNIALVPGTTNVPVGVETVNDGVGGCSNYTQYYNNNVGSSDFVYSGFTDVFSALAQVSPCDTYHLKLAIADASDHIFDSGVFLKAGSLTSTAITVKTFGGAGLETPFTNTVRGCPPGIVTVGRTGNLSQPVTIPLQFSGTAVNGVDYQFIPDSIVIPAGDSLAQIEVVGITGNPPTGAVSCIISALSPYTCGNGAPAVLSSDTIYIFDSIYVDIVTPDTIICVGESVDIETESDSMLSFTWTPASTVDDPTAKNVTVTPLESTTYTVSVNLPLATGCPPSSDQIFISVKETPQVDAGPDLVTCGSAVQLFAATTPYNPDETFTWSPATGLSNPNIRDPQATVNTNTQYIVTVNPGAIGCNGYDTVMVTLLPDHIDVLNTDTAVCAGTVLQLQAFGDDHFSYNWTPEGDIENDTVKNTVLIAQESGYYTLTASYPGCVDMPDSFYLTVEPNPEVSIGPDRVICTYDTVQLYASVLPNDFNAYSYAWTPSEDLNDTTLRNPVFDGDEDTRIIAQVTTPLGCFGADTLQVTVHPGDFMTVSSADTGICPLDTVSLSASGAASYVWTPAWGLDDPYSDHPTAAPETTTEYVVVGTSNLNCLDTGRVIVEVYPSAVTYLPDSVTIWPGESYQMEPGGNAHYFSWFPPSGLSASDIANPIASPEVRTRYFLVASTEWGCSYRDSIDVLVNTETALDAPNAFTPGSDPNGEFRIVKRGMATLKAFRIYNRWGNKVFETNDIDEGWDGTYNGEPQPMGVYLYEIDAVTSTGKVFRKTGNLTLIR